MVLDLWWEAVRPVERPYTAFVHLFQTTEPSLETFLAQDDRLIGNEYFPTDQWPLGTRMRMRHRLSSGGPCHPCLLRVGIYDRYGERDRLPSGADAVEFLLEEGTLRLRPPAP